EGIDAGGHRLYPAFPYPYYTHVTRGDVADIRAYLQSIAPVSNRPPANELPFPLNERTVMHVWNWMYFKDGTFKPDPKKSQQWNRGAYLVEGLGHCGACHTPKNFAGADDSGSALHGGNLQSWFAPDLGPDLRVGLGHWSSDDIAEYLKTGRDWSDVRGRAVFDLEADRRRPARNRRLSQGLADQGGGRRRQHQALGRRQCRD